ncbi:MAG TPA: MarR family transcriptional regulator [Acidimicrobiales bacterium]|nr:MarR family transcriptional regulator [Acidimicrobiales bacterium]
MRDRTNSVNPLPYEEGWERPTGVREDGTTLLLDVWLVSRATHGLLDEALAPAGLTADEFAVYSMLRGSEQGSTPGELAGWMAAPATTVSSYVKRFEGRGHVERVPNPDDRRSYRLRLTDDGRAAHLAAAQRFTPVLAQVLVALADTDRTEADVTAALAALLSALTVARTGP